MAPGTGSETIGQRLKRLRLERHLSQRELAAPGVSYAYISRIEAGTRQPSVKALRRLAAKLEVSPEYLETGSEIRDADARELRLADAELSLRLEESPEAEAQLQAILDEALAGGDAVNARRARIALGFAAHGRGDHAAAVERLEAAIEAERPSPIDRPDVYSTLGHSYAVIGTPERAAELFDWCLKTATETTPEDTATQIRYASLLSYALSDMGDYGRAESVVRSALERAQEQVNGDPYVRVRLYWSLARLSEMEGDSTAALSHVRRAIALLETTEDTLHLARAHILCAWIMTSQGNPTAAQGHLDQAERLLGAHPSRDDEAMLNVERARASAGLGAGRTAVDLSRRAIELIGDRDAAELGSAYAALADGLALEGETDAAGEAFARAAELLEEQRRWREATQACQAWAKTLRASGREAEALDVLERAAELSLRVVPASAAATDR
jgi:transcriptional regulator with XRE-family HTH domain